MSRFDGTWELPCKYLYFSKDIFCHHVLLVLGHGSWMSSRCLVELSLGTFNLELNIKIFWLFNISVRTWWFLWNICVSLAVPLRLGWCFNEVVTETPTQRDICWSLYLLRCTLGLVQINDTGRGYVCDICHIFYYASLTSSRLDAVWSKS